MRKVLRDSREVAHVWAHQLQSEGRSGNVSFHGRVIFSYAAPIGCILEDGRVWLSNRSYSNTTSRHQSYVRQAVNHMPRVFSWAVPEDGDALGIRLAHSANFDYFTRELVARYGELAAYPRRNRRLGAEISALVSAKNDYRDAFQLDWPTETMEGSEQACREAAKALAEQHRLDAIRREKARLAQIERQREDLAAWRLGGFVYSHFEVTALRIKEDMIETTKGARIPVEHAKKVWPLLTALKDGGRTYKRNGHTIHLGPYALDEFDAKGTLHVGCHHIPWQEIEQVAVQLGLNSGEPQ